MGRIRTKEDIAVDTLLIGIATPKGVKLRFGYDHIAPSGCGDANQEGTDSYVHFGSNTTHV